MNSFDVIRLIVSGNKDIVGLNFFEFGFSPSIQERLPEFFASNDELISMAGRLKAEFGLPFWESLIVSGTSLGCLDESVIDSILFHQENLAVKEVSSAGFEKFFEGKSDCNIALNSKIILSGERVAHLPLLDFKISVGGSSLSLVVNCIKALRLKGYVLDSGRSYHFIGLNPVTSEELTRLLARFVLLHPISDKSWAAHQLLEGSASLRVSSKFGRFPQLVEQV